MRKLTFGINVILLSIFLIETLYSNLKFENTDENLLLLLFIGFYQISLSLGITFYSINKNKKLLIFYLIYWLLIYLYLLFMGELYFYSCLFIAVYNLYLNYCSFSNSKFNITKS
jgi:hypothetical protein